MPQYRAEARRLPPDDASQRHLLRCLMNVREPAALPAAFLAAQDALLSCEREERGVVSVSGLPCVPGEERLALWQGDITRLDADAIVNAANAQLLGCFRSSFILSVLLFSPSRCFLSLPSFFLGLPCLLFQLFYLVYCISKGKLATVWHQGLLCSRKTVVI